MVAVSLLTDVIIDCDNESAIDKRILSLINNCCENKNDAEKYLDGVFYVPLRFILEAINGRVIWKNTSNNEAAIYISFPSQGK